MSLRQRGVKPQRKNAGGRQSEQHPYHPHPKRSSVQSAVGDGHRESVSTATNEHAKIDHQNLPNNPRLRGKSHHRHRWGTTDDSATSFLHFSLFSTAVWDLANSRLVHSLMLSSNLFLCLPCLLPRFTVPCKMVLATPDERENVIIPPQFASLYDCQVFVCWTTHNTHTHTQIKNKSKTAKISVTKGQSLNPVKWEGAQPRSKNTSACKPASEEGKEQRKSRTRHPRRGGEGGGRTKLSSGQLEQPIEKSCSESLDPKTVKHKTLSAISSPSSNF